MKMGYFTISSLFASQELWN